MDWCRIPQHPQPCARRASSQLPEETVLMVGLCELVAAMQLVEPGTKADVAISPKRIESKQDLNCSKCPEEECLDKP